MKKIELLSPAGSLQKLKYALIYGADAVYVGLKDLSLRSSGLSLEEIEKAVEVVRDKNKKIYIALNVFAHNTDIDKLLNEIDALNEIKPDALIAADPGVINIIRSNSTVPIHVSTQANITNYASVLFWQDIGAKRVTLAREMSLDEISEINSKVKIETEVFVHGAMCLSYSGRCYLSHYFDGRDANKGDCAQPCRWNYYLEEEKSGEVYQVETNEGGSYILSSKDLNLIGYLPQLIDSEVSSLKIEGRMKSIHYVATVTKVYRQAIDKYFENPEKFKIEDKWLEELEKVSHRPYSTGFIDKSAASSQQSTGKDLQVKGKESYQKSADFVGEVIGQENGYVKIAVRNKLLSGEKLDVLTPQGDNLSWTIKDMVDFNTDMPLDVAHANYVIKAEGKSVPADRQVKEYSLLRRSNANKTDT